MPVCGICAEFLLADICEDPEITLIFVVLFFLHFRIQRFLRGNNVSLAEIQTGVLLQFSQV